MRRTHPICCEAELIITPAFPIKERQIVCCHCGKADNEVNWITADLEIVTDLEIR